MDAATVEVGIGGSGDGALEDGAGVDVLEDSTTGSTGADE